MTLTEEQREAIRVISKLPMAIGCQLCHPYIMKNYGSHFIVLRDMIDSSGTVEPTGGFDLEKVRAVLEEAIDRMSLTVSDEDGPIWEADPEQTAILQEMLDRIGRYTNNDYLDLQYQLDSADAEIERLRAKNLELQVAVFGPDGIRAHQACIIADQAASISELEIEIAELKADLEQSEEIKRLKDELENYGDHYACLLISKDAQIKELESSLDEAETLTKKNAELMNAYLARIAELEAALVEERANKMIQADDCTQNQDAADFHHRCICEYNVKKCPIEQWWLDRARITLQAEGKIGPDAKPRSWQITEERKAALAAMSNLSETISCPDCGVWIGFADIGPHMAVLRAMLREAEQCE